MLTIPASAEVKKFMRHCPERQQLCAFFDLVLTPPQGWLLDEQASRENRVQMLLPRGKTFHGADAVMYVRVSPKQKDQELAEFVRVSQQRWKESVPDSKITKLPDVERANGKPAFLSYRYENPSRPQQRFEAVSFAHDKDSDGNEFTVMVALSGMKKQAVDGAMKPYQAFLKAH